MSSSNYLRKAEALSMPSPVNMRDGFRQAVWNKTGGKCSYCGCELADDRVLVSKVPTMTIDHVEPRSKGGRHTLSNCVPACISCNAKKGARIE